MQSRHSLPLLSLRIVCRRQWLPLFAVAVAAYCCSAAHSFAADNPAPRASKAAASGATGGAASAATSGAPAAEKAAPPANKATAPAAPATPAVPPKTPPAAAAKAKSGDKKSELPKMEELMLTTNDGLRLVISYYPGTLGKDSVPVVLLHMWKQSRADYQDLALYLQSRGHAVVVPDLRGHGQSTRFKGTKKDEDLKAASMPPAQYGHMVNRDMLAVKDFLWDRNNAGELNLDKLCVVGAEMGAVVALDFAAFDAVGYEHNMTHYGPLKLGGFVKAIVLLSPEWSFKGLSLKQAASLATVQRDIAVLICVGAKDAKALADAKRVAAIFERFHPEPAEQNKAEQRSFYFVRLETSLQGTKLLDPKFRVQEDIANFIDLRLVKSDKSLDWAWKERKRPHE